MGVLYTRNDWGARPPSTPIDFTTWEERLGVAFHYSDTSTYTSVRSIQRHSMDDLGYRDMMYNALVDVWGNVWEGREGGWLAIAAHALEQNTPWIGICFIGREGDATPAAFTAMRDLFDALTSQAGHVLQVAGHRELPGQSTDCPGDTIIRWIDRGMPRFHNFGGVNDMSKLVSANGSPAVWLTNGFEHRGIATEADVRQLELAFGPVVKVDDLRPYGLPPVPGMPVPLVPDAQVRRVLRGMLQDIPAEDV